jgi:hypothetical protein
VLVIESCHGVPNPLKASQGISRHALLKNAFLKVNSMPFSFTAFVPVINLPTVLPLKIPSNKE